MKIMMKLPTIAMIALGVSAGTCSASTVVTLTASSFGGGGCGSGDRVSETFEFSNSDTPEQIMNEVYPGAFSAPVRVSFGDEDCTAITSTYAARGALGVRGDIEISDPSDSTGVFAGTDLRATDIRVSRTIRNSDQTEDGEITIRPNLILSGQIFDNNGGSSAALRASFSLVGTDGRGNLSGDTDTIAIGTGLIDPTIGPVPVYLGQFETNAFLIDPSQALTLNLSLRGSASARRNTDPVGLARFDSYGSLSFNPDGPAFFVPEGYTVNAPSLGIFDNQWIDTRIAVVDPGPSPVPLPASALLLIAGLGGLVTLRKRQT